MYEANLPPRPSAGRPDPLHDAGRLRAVRESGLLDAAPEEAFDRLTRLASAFLRAPVSLLTVLEEDRQFFKSALGLEGPWAVTREMPIEYSYCRHALASPEPLVIPDAREDPRTQGSPAIAEHGSIAYLGVPLRTREGHALGTLCVVDGRPRAWTEEEARALRDLAAGAMTELELRREIAEHRRTAAELAETLARDREERRQYQEALERAYTELERQVEAATSELLEVNRELRDSRTELDALIRSMNDVIMVLSAEGRYLRIAPTAVPRLLRAHEELLGRTIHERFDRETAAMFQEAIDTTLATRRTQSLEYALRLGERTVWFSTLLSPMEGERVLLVARDIGALKEAEARTRAQREFLRAVIDASPSLIFAKDREGRFTLANLAVAEIYGTTPEELVGRTDADFNASPEEVERFLQDDRDVIETGASRLVQEEPVTNATTGEVRWFETRKVRLQPPDGGPAQVLGVATDVTERRLAAGRERELIRAEAERVEAEAAHRRIERILESITDAFVALDREWRITSLNERAVALCGRPRGSLAGRTLWSLFPGLLDGEPRRSLQRAMTEQVPVEFDLYAPSLDLWLQVHVYPSSEGVSAFIRDITLRRRAEEALRESEERFREIAENVREAFWLYTADFSRAIYMSPAYAAMWGESVEELYEDPLAFLRRVHPDDVGKIRRAMRSVQKGDLVIPFRVVRADGTLRHVEARVQPLRDPDTGAVLRILGVTDDVTVQVEREAALRVAKEEAERASQAKSEFLSRMSHELRTPMNAILGFSQILEMDLERPDDRESVQQILRAGRHLLNLIDEVLDLAKIESGRVPLSLEPVSVAQVVRETVDLVRAQAAQEGIALLLPDGFGGVHVRADQQRLKQVLLNLLSNAVKYNHAGGAVQVTCEPRGEGIRRIAVRDTGPGLTPQQQARLFTPFSRLGAERTSIPGTGLGLALSRGIVEAMGGEMGLESAAGEGSTFWVDLPAVASPASQMDDAVRGVPDAAIAGSDRVVLYVEDNLSNLRLVERILAPHPEITLVPAMHGKLALEMARDHPPDLVLLDLHLPDVHGGEVLAELKRDPQLRDVPVVVVSADATPRQVERLLAAGAREYLTKPIDVGRFLETVRAALAEREPNG